MHLCTYFTVVVNYGAPDYGYIEGGVTMENEVVVIVRRDQRNPDRPAHDIKKFSKDLGSETSKIYFYNAIWSNNTNILGLGRILFVLLTRAVIYTFLFCRDQLLQS